MRPTICLIALCVFLTACSHNRGPSAARIEAALNQVLKAKNPDAVAKVYSTNVEKPYVYKEFKFSCTNCVLEFKDGERHVVPSCEGHGIVALRTRNQLWEFANIVVASPGIGQVVYKSDHIF